MIPRSRPPTAHFLPTSEGSRARSHDTNNASASRWTMVGVRVMELVAARLGAKPAALVELGARLLGTSQFVQGDRHLVVDVGIIWSLAQGLLVLGDGRRISARSRQGVSQVGAGFRVAGTQAHR